MNLKKKKKLKSFGRQTRALNSSLFFNVDNLRGLTEKILISLSYYDSLVTREDFEIN
jgi:hypothetical protein